MVTTVLRYWFMRIGALGVGLALVVACAPPPGINSTHVALNQTGEDPNGAGIVPAAKSKPPVTATPLPTQGTPRRPIYVIDPNNQGLISSIFMIDPDAARVAWTITTRNLPEAALSPDGKRLYVADSYRAQVTRGELRDVISVYNAASGELLLDDAPLSKRLLYKAIPQPGHPNLFLSEDGRLIFAGLYGEPDIHQLRMAVLDAETLDVMHVGPWPDCDPTGMDDYDRQACGRLSSLITGWEIHAGKIELPEGWKESGETLHSPDGKLLYVGFDTGYPEADVFTDQVGVYETGAWERLAVLRLPGPVNQIALSADGSQLYTISPFTRSLVIINTTTYQEQAVMEGLGGSPALILIPRDR